MSKKTPSFTEAQLLASGIAPDQVSYQLIDDSPRGRREVNIFRQDQQGNMEIIYLELDGSQAYYEKGRHRRAIPYRVTRLAEPQGGTKYIVPRGTPTRIFLTPNIIQAYQQKQRLDTLIITEGQKKAWKGYLEGLPIVGISGIWNFRQGKGLKLKDSLQMILETCQVKNLIMLQDADCLQVKWAEDKNLTDRLYSFYGAVKCFREIMKASDCDTYFAHIHINYQQTAKGLDDLYVLEKGKEKVITRELLSLSKASTYFSTYNITDHSLYKLKQLFHLADVQDFYATYASQVGRKTFLWHKGKYQFNETTGKVEMVKHPDAFKFIRVGDIYFKRIQHMNSKREVTDVLKQRQISTIKQDYVHELGLKKFLEWIEKYDDFCVVPDHSTDFQTNIYTPNYTKLYNLAYPMPYQPAAGDFQTILGFLRHVFGEQELSSGLPRYLMAVDYLTVAYRYPTHKLPVIVLVSKEGKTGKSTFLFLLRQIFGANAVIAGNDDISDTYNDSYITKEFCMVDEGVIEKRVVLEKVKSLSTTTKAHLHGKYHSKQEVDCNLKFIFTSNDENNCIYIRPEERRFWVVKVPTVTGHFNPDLLEEMTAEIPAFLYHLQQREIAHKRADRMWFDESLLITPALMRLIKGSKSWLEKELNEVIRERMLDFAEPEICMTYTEIEAAVCRNKKYQRFEIIRILQEKLELKPHNSTYYRLEWVGTGEHKSVQRHKEKGRFYRFQAQDFLTPDEINLITQLPD